MNIGNILPFVVLGTSIWVFIDARKIGVRKMPEHKSMLNASPIGWLIASLLIWIVAFPFYIANRSKLKDRFAAGADVTKAPTVEWKKALIIMGTLILVIGFFLRNIPLEMSAKKALEENGTECISVTVEKNLGNGFHLGKVLMPNGATVMITIQEKDGMVFVRDAQ